MSSTKSKYPDPMNQYSPWHTVVYKVKGIWVAHHTTYSIGAAEAALGGLINLNTFANEGLKIIHTNDNKDALNQCLLNMNKGGV